MARDKKAKYSGMRKAAKIRKKSKDDAEKKDAENKGEATQTPVKDEEKVKAPSKPKAASKPKEYSRPEPQPNVDPMQQVADARYKPPEDQPSADATIVATRAIRKNQLLKGTAPAQWIGGGEYMYEASPGAEQITISGGPANMPPRTIGRDHPAYAAILDEYGRGDVREVPVFEEPAMDPFGTSDPSGLGESPQPQLGMPEGPMQESPMPPPPGPMEGPTPEFDVAGEVVAETGDPKFDVAGEVVAEPGGPQVALSSPGESMQPPPLGMPEGPMQESLQPEGPAAPAPEPNVGESPPDVEPDLAADESPQGGEPWMDAIAASIIENPERFKGAAQDPSFQEFLAKQPPNVRQLLEGLLQ